MFRFESNHPVIMSKFFLTFFLQIFTFCLIAQSPVIHNIIPVSKTVEVFQKYEAKIDLTAVFANGYDYEEVSLSASVSRPDGKVDVIDGFYLQPYNINADSGSLSASGPNTFMIRYAPSLVGTYSYELLLKDKNGTVTSEKQSFESVPASTLKNKGFIRTSKTNYLQFDDQSQYVAIGENMCWQSDNVYHDYRDWIKKLENNGGNFIRLWHAHWGLGMEWIPWNNYEGLLKYNQHSSAYQDWLYDYCAEKGIYVMLALEHHGQVSTRVNPNWEWNPYNKANGGPCANTWDFFINEQAKKITKNRYRYIVARWAYSRAIMTWELFNEVEWTDKFDTYKDQIIAWHIEMANYIKSIDVYDHILSTSFANDQEAETLWNDVSMDLTQQHFYDNTSAIHSAVSNLNRHFLRKYDKPTLMGEFGLGGSSPSSKVDANGIHIHNTLWATLMSGSAGTAMSWWWDKYIDPGNLYYHFGALTKVSGMINFLKDDMKPGIYTISKAPADLQAFTLVESEINSDTASNAQAYQASSAARKLQTLENGPQINSPYRPPRSFEQAYKDTSKVIADDIVNNTNSPIKMRSVVKPEIIAEINSYYSPEINTDNNQNPADSAGPDGMGMVRNGLFNPKPLLESYGVVASNGQSGAAWILNRNYNHQTVRYGFLPKPVNTGMLTVNDVMDGDYQVTFFETLSGNILATNTVIASNGQLIIRLPAIDWDIAMKFERTNITIAKDVTLKQLEVSPNPAKAGDTINISSDDFMGKFIVTIFDSEGHIKDQKNVQSDGRFTLRLKEDLSNGIYFVKVSNDSGEVAEKTISVDEK